MLDIKEMLEIARQKRKKVPDNCEEQIKVLLEDLLGNMNDAEIEYLGEGSSNIVFKLKKDKKSYVLKIGNAREGFPKRGHQRIIKSLIYEALSKECIIEVQKMVKTYSDFGRIEDDVITSKEVASLVNELVKKGIIICDLEVPLKNVGRDENGEVVWIDKENIYTKEELDEIGPQEWDNICDRAIYGREKRPIGVCYGPGHLKRRREELIEAGLLPKDPRNKGPEH